MDLSRFDARDLGYTADAVKPFEDLAAYELARRVRVERAIVGLARSPRRDRARVTS